MTTITITPNMAAAALADMESWQAKEARYEAEMDAVYAEQVRGVAQAIFADSERLRAIREIASSYQHSSMTDDQFVLQVFNALEAKIPSNSPGDAIGKR